MTKIYNRKMATLQLKKQDYGKYALFDAQNGDGELHPVFISFNLLEVQKKAKELKEKGLLEHPAIEQVKDPSICWNF